MLKPDFLRIWWWGNYRHTFLVMFSFHAARESGEKIETGGGNYRHKFLVVGATFIGGNYRHNPGIDLEHCLI